MFSFHQIGLRGTSLESSSHCSVTQFRCQDSSHVQSFAAGTFQNPQCANCMFWVLTALLELLKQTDLQVILRGNVSPLDILHLDCSRRET